MSASARTASTEVVLDVHDLQVEFRTPDRSTGRGQHRIVRALDGASLTATRGERLAIAGESGSGKSTLGTAIGRLLPANATIAGGSIEVEGVDVASLDAAALRAVRRDRLGFIPQDPIATLDPTKRVGKQLALVVRDLGGDASTPALEAMLDAVRIADPPLVLRRFPHELSGGMAQRVAVAMAMAREPAILVADEPTAALDANVRREVLRLLFARADEQGSTVLWLSHDLDAVAEWCDRVAVMHRGLVVEVGDARTVLTTPSHPYTQSLLAAMPSRLVKGEEVRTYTEMLQAAEPAPRVASDTVEGDAR